MRKVLITGAAGNVGKGLTEAFFLAGWKVYAVDPALSTSTDVCPSEQTAKASTSSDKEKSNQIGQIMRFPIKIEEIEETTIMTDLLEEHDSGRNEDCLITVCYAAEDGNRDNYASNPALAKENVHRFSSFVKKLSCILSSNQSSCMKLNEQKLRNEAQNDLIPKRSISVHILYCGGSWTRRQMDNDFIVCDESPVKQNGGDNPYERAKTMSCLNAEKLAMEHKDWCKISFIDYISVVPNYAPNFSIGKMVRDAIYEGTIIYSKGPFGRPLLHTREAGKIVVALASKQLNQERHLNNQKKRQFEVILFPGSFIPFEQFACTVREAITSDERLRCEHGELALKEQKFSPNFLRSQCTSKHVEREFGIYPDPTLVLNALRVCAEHAITKYCDKLNQDQK